MSQVAAIVSSFFLALVMCGEACAAGVFDGESFLSVADPLIDGETEGTPDYPVLIWGWVKLDDLDHNGTFLMSTDADADNYLLTHVLGGNANDPIRAVTRGGSSQSSVINNAAVADEWLFVLGYYEAGNRRRVYVGTTVGSTANTEFTVTGLTTSYIGAYNGSASFLSGKLAEVGFASGYTNGDTGDIIAALAAGTRPIDIPELAPHIKSYQPLRTGLNDSGYIGPSWTNEGVTFDPDDHPIEYASGGKYMILRKASE